MAKKIKRIRSGYRSYIKGRDFEVKIANTLSRKGYKTTIRKSTKTLGEVDIIGKKKGGWFSSDEFICVECKCKKKIPVNDVVKFFKKFKRFFQRHRDAKVKGIFYYKGSLDPSVRTFWNIIPKEFKKHMELRKV